LFIFEFIHSFTARIDELYPYRDQSKNGNNLNGANNYFAILSRQQPFLIEIHSYLYKPPIPQADDYHRA
jgi:hypothetical protein